MNKPLFAIVGTFALALLLVGMLMRGERRPEKTRNPDGVSSIKLYCAASNRRAMEAIRADYEREFGRRIDIQYGASQTLLSSMEVSKDGELFLPADGSYLELANQKKLIEETFELATMRAVVAVRQGNPKKIQRWNDLLRDDVKLVQANPDAAAIGHLTKEALSTRGLWDDLEKATIGFRTTVNDAASDVVVGAADAAIVFDAAVFGMKELEIVSLEELQPIQARVQLGVIASTPQATEALHFARYIASQDRGLKRYRENGFDVVDGDTWSDVPELTLYAGSMLRPAIEDTIKAFEKREGVKITRSYNGCGILVAQMKSGQRPDAYFACDREFMNQVPDLFPNPEDISSNRLVILVKKGNPHGIASLKDLAKPNLKVGIGHEKQCAMGWLTQNTLRESGLQQEVMSNVTVQTPTGDMLVNQLQAGSLDAAVAYLSNAAGKGDFLDAVAIEGLPCSIATQPFGIAKDTKNRSMAQRFLKRVHSNESRETFLAEGFEWKAENRP